MSKDGIALVKVDDMQMLDVGMAEDFEGFGNFAVIADYFAAKIHPADFFELPERWIVFP